MSKITNVLLTILFTLSVAEISSARPTSPREDTVLITFRFQPREDLFTLMGNEAALNRLYAFLDKYRAKITEDKISIRVDSYCTSLPTAKENLNTAFTRANQVKSEMILHKDLKEANFITANYATTYNGNRDIVVVTFHIPEDQKPLKNVSSIKPKQPEPQQPEPAKDTTRQIKPVVTTSKPPIEPADTPGFHRFAIRTNVLYDAVLLPTLGVEWRINRNISMKLDGSIAWWGSQTGKVQKIWILNPEIRWYLGYAKQLYTGISGHYGKYNLYKYSLGRLISNDTGYQGDLWSTGITIGYQLPLSRSLSVDFNLGLGYTHFEYDSFTVTDHARNFKFKKQNKNFWGPTQIVINLIWKLSDNNNKSNKHEN